MKALTADEMREVDRLTTERLGIASLQLMETAGSLAASCFAERIREAGLQAPAISVLCGKGNNGGDGFVVARHLYPAGGRVRVYLFAGLDDLRGDAATNLQRWRSLGGEVISLPDERSWEALRSEVESADVIVDAIFGTGFRGAVSGAVGQAIADINRMSRDATAAR